MPVLEQLKQYKNKVFWEESVHEHELYKRFWFFWPDHVKSESIELPESFCRRENSL